MTGFTNPPIGKALVASHAKQIFGAFCIRDFQSGAAIVTEIELGKVAVQMSLAAMLIDANHAALEDREHVLNRVEWIDTPSS